MDVIFLNRGALSRSNGNICGTEIERDADVGFHAFHSILSLPVTNRCFFSC